MNESIMSFFHAPVSNKVPAGVCNLAGLHAYITADKRLQQLTRDVRTACGDEKLFRKKKQSMLPYVTPAGIFPYGKELCLTLPSGLFVIDIDHLDTAAEAEEWRNRLFADSVLCPDLAFISPGGRGVKLFVPYRLNPAESIKQSFSNALHAAWDYIGWKYGLAVDTANADMSRACFLSHDEGAKLAAR